MSLMHTSLRFIAFCIIFFSLSACTLTSPDVQKAQNSDLSSGEKYQDKLTDAQKIGLIRDRRKELDSIRK